MTKKTKLKNAKSGTAYYAEILEIYPDLPPFQLLRGEFPMLSALYELSYDVKFLRQLQQQSFLATFYSGEYA